ncbi:MAG: DNA-protecting protein DprA [Microbacterium sp.]|uniref:DNA-processing protein DprA n=1 Tax=Microbacterium sp. TaxID=51671 RepID=UPI001AC39811|nr:DNA-processing protein DprA [Microbacterium sp.]MBN9214143.1 DNA-protecting protein DprA [Microbacterium sp.]
MSTVDTRPSAGGSTSHERHRAITSALARAGAVATADDRRELVARLIVEGPEGGMRWALDQKRQRGPLGALARKLQAIVDVPRWGHHELVDLRAADDADGTRFITRGCAEWPEQLNDLGDLAPIGLWVQGAIPDMGDGAISIVGSRNLSSTGHSRIDRAVTGLPVPIISGLALGADETAHRAALLRGVPTVAVLPSGIDKPYPHVNRHLAERIVASGGALITETPAGIGTARHRFLDRNRIIAALSTGSLIVEAGAISGTMSEARHAHALRRRLAAFPGTAGCDQLIASGMAYPVISRTDVDALYTPDVATS